MSNLIVKDFYHNSTGSFTYVVFDKNNDGKNEGVIIDPVMDFDFPSASISNDHADIIISYIYENDITIKYILETHIHADHLTSANYIKNKIGGKTAISSEILKVLSTWNEIFNFSNYVHVNANHFDILLADNSTLEFANHKIEVLHTTGHTPACASFVIGKNIFVGDTIFSPEIGTARTDFPGGSSAELYTSIMKLYSYPDDYNLYMCHDYPKEDNAPTCKITIKDEKQNNILIKANTSKDEFVKARDNKNDIKNVPKLLLPSLQYNLASGEQPPKEENGIAYLKIPINVIGK